MSDDLDPDVSPILGADGRHYHTGLLQPPGKPDNFVSARPRVQDEMQVWTEAEIQAAINDPNRTPASEIFADDCWTINGDQHQTNACGGWGGAGAFSKTRYKLGISQDKVSFSGSYPYSWCNRGSDNGSVIEDIMNELMNRGTVPASMCPWQKIYRKDTQAYDGEAVKHTGLALYSVKTQAEMDTVLARGQFVVVCVQVDRTQYVNYKGSGLVPAFRGPGNHCIHVDDMRYVNGVKQYRQFGNWGKFWGNAGTGWCTFASFAQPIQNHSFYAFVSVNDMVA